MSEMDKTINRKARRKGQWEQGHDGNYDLFDRGEYIAACLEAGRPLAIIWARSTVRLCCRYYTDVYGVPDLFGVEEIPTLFSNKKGMENLRIFLIPYLITGYDIPPELEQDSELLVPFTAETIKMVKEIEGEPVWPGWMK